ncbi:MAG: MutS-related protein [Candidatus Sulfotelmatobacter sp.]
MAIEAPVRGPLDSSALAVDLLHFLPVLPSDEYKRRLGDRERRIAHCETIHIRLGNIRLALALLLVVIAFLAFKTRSISAWWLCAPAAAFAGVAVYHSRILQVRELAERAARYYMRGLARIEDRWSGTGETGERFSDPHHVYAVDLDLFGQNSLFQLLSAARMRMGEETLAKWLLAPSPVEAVRERHACVSELRNQLDLREDVAVLGDGIKVGVHPQDLLNWAEAPNRMKPLWFRWLAVSLAALAVLAAIVWAVWGTLTPLLVMIAIEAVPAYRMRKLVDEVLHGAEHAFRDLDLLSGVLARIEAHVFQSPRLQALQRELSSSAIPGSQAIAKLRSLVELTKSRHNTMVRIIDVPLMYSVQVAFAAERWRQAHGRALRAWITAIGEIEAILSLAAYSFEHPGDPFPEFADGTAVFEGDALGHPLVASTACVRNSVSIAGATRILLVSGSNMSGKSTLLRSVGINVVLAMAGAPVRAGRLRLTPLQVGASIRVNDSLQEGSSRFYAEITRLRQIFDLAGKDPALLFLLDELLQGTNSKDRRIGAEGIVRALVARGAIGLVSTHDLALTDIGGDGHLRNVHFQDELANGRISFDYTLRDGVVTRSNGLELMRSIGLDV